MQNIVQQSRSSKPAHQQAVKRKEQKKQKKLVGNCATENVMENNNETKRVKIKYKNRARGHTQARYPIAESLCLGGLPGIWTRSIVLGRLDLKIVSNWCYAISQVGESLNHDYRDLIPTYYTYDKNKLLADILKVYILR